MRQIQKDTIAKTLAVQPCPQKILDVGCASGYFTRALASVFPHSYILAIDPEASKLAANTDRIRYLQGTVEALPFTTQSFDVAVACMSLHHWDNKQKGIQEIFRVLKPHGSVVIGDPFFEGLMRNRFMAWVLQATDGGRFTFLSDLEQYMEYAGFESSMACPVANSFGTMFVVSAGKS